MCFVCTTMLTSWVCFFLPKKDSVYLTSIPIVLTLLCHTKRILLHILFDFVGECIRVFIYYTPALNTQKTILVG